MEKRWQNYVKKVISQDRTTEKLDLDEVKGYFTGLGFEVVAIEQPWRHVIGKLRKGRRDYFLKLGCTPEISQNRTRREKLWLEYVGQYISGKETFIVPHTYESGLFRGNLFWFIDDWFEPNFLSVMKPADPKNLERWIPAIAKAAAALLKIPVPQPGEELYMAMYPNDEHEPKPADRLRANAHVWAEESGQDLVDLLVEIDQTAKQIKSGKLPSETAVTHGDFVPWHMIEVDKGRFALTDGDLGSFRTPKYYDAANFYRSVWVHLGERYSRQFLRHFLGIYQPKSMEEFWIRFRPVLAQRIIGGFWDHREKPEYRKANQVILQAFRQNNLV